MNRVQLCVFLLVLLVSSEVSADNSVQLAQQPSLSPDGEMLLFVHRQDIWRVETKGGQAQQLTSHHASDKQPIYSPDGQTIAFVSNRTGHDQVYTMPATGGEAQQLTFHSEGFSLQDWYPDGQHLLVLGSRDHHWRHAGRFMKIDANQRSAEKVIFNGYGAEGKISPDGKTIVFIREGERWWRKGYTGSRSAQIWSYQIDSDTFTKLVDTPAGNRSPVWSANGESIYYCSSDGAKNGARNLFQLDIEAKQSTQLTQFDDDLVATPTISRDGKTIVFSQLFDLHSWSITDGVAAKIEIGLNTDNIVSDTHRRTLKSVTDAAFSHDGLEIAFISGGDLWVMETELKEPIQVTDSPEFESDPIFADEGKSLLFVGWKDGQADIWKAERADDSKYWWQTSDFTLTQVTDDADLESRLTLSPNGDELFYAKGRGDLWVRDLKSGESSMLVDSFIAPSYDVSPDGKWIVYSQTDDNFNNDIWIGPVDQSSDPVNVSRHPDDEYGPKWSSDGKIIAFSGRRSDDEIDLYYMYLTEEDDDNGSRDRKLKKALEAFKKSRKKSKATPAKSDPKDTPKKVADASTEKPDDADDDGKNEKSDKDQPDEKPVAKDSKKLPDVKIDFKDIHRRLKRISVPDGSETVLGWNPDGNKLLFRGSVKNETGTWSVTFPDELTPKKVTGNRGSIKGWLKSPDRMLWVTDGIPAVQPLSGKGKSYTLSAYQTISQSARYKAGFETAWRIMRDAWYDKNYGNHNWDQIRRKYSPAAQEAGDSAGFSRVMSLMLGELNGSHLGFYPQKDLGPAMDGGDDWKPTTAHLGVRFDSTFKGPGLKIKDIIPNGPATDADSLLNIGEVILSIDGTPVDPDIDLTTVLNGRSSRNVELKVKAKGKKATERSVTLRPTTYGRVRSSLYQKWQDDNRAMVAKKSDNIGYLHIQGMNWSSFLDFERELYDVGYGKDGLIIDVRDNGGGSTTDHLLTALTQPDHAVTVPRGGGPGYPQSRKVYATWNKPIVVMCNQNSYSNAEIFSHAIKNMGRGKLIGVATAGGVISTGAARVMDVGTVRLPFRGWYVKSTGEDMELNGAIPDVTIWPKPAEIPNGKDRQLKKAVQVLKQEIKKWKAKEQPVLRKATER